MNIFRRLRGMFGTSLVWAGLWGVFGLVYAGALSLFFLATNRVVSLHIFAGNLIMNTAFWVTWGAVAGLGFSGALMLGRSSNAFKDLSARRVALCGAAGGMLGPLFAMGIELSATGRSTLAYLPPYYVAGAVLGSACALATLWIARRDAGSDADSGSSDPVQLSEGVPDFSAARSRHGAHQRR